MARIWFSYGGQWLNLGTAHSFTFTVKTQKGKGMPRGRHRVPRTPKVKVPKPAKIPRPKTKDLRMVLKGLVTVSIQNRIASLSYALQWYDGALHYLITKGLITPALTKTLEIAVKCRKQGIGTNIDHEKEAAFLMAIRQYEKAAASLKPPSVDSFVKLFQAKKAEMELKQQKLLAKFGNIIEMLQKSIGNRVKLEVADAPKEVQYNPAMTSLSYNRDAAKNLALKFRAEGLLAVFVDQLDVLAKHAALQSDGKGGWEYSVDRHLEVERAMLLSFIEFAKTGDAPGKLVRSGNFAPKTPRQPGSGAPRVFHKGPKVAGLYVQGSAGATVYERLIDGKPWKFVDLFNGISFANPVWLVRRMVRHGKTTGVWEVVADEKKGTAHMTKLPAGVQP
jgi:hypothetical protein